jgi:hypothetical protein
LTVGLVFGFAVGCLCAIATIRQHLSTSAPVVRLSERRDEAAGEVGEVGGGEGAEGAAGAASEWGRPRERSGGEQQPHQCFRHPPTGVLLHYTTSVICAVLRGRCEVRPGVLHIPGGPEDARCVVERIFAGVCADGQVAVCTLLLLRRSLVVPSAPCVATELNALVVGCVVLAHKLVRENGVLLLPSATTPEATRIAVERCEAYALSLLLTADPGLFVTNAQYMAELVAVVRAGGGAHEREEGFAAK